MLIRMIVDELHEEPIETIFPFRTVVKDVSKGTTAINPEAHIAD
jgi:hypothetical protein